MGSDATNGLRDTLESVTARAGTIGRKEGAMMQALDEAEAARRVALETWQQRVASLVARVETMAPQSHTRRESWTPSKPSGPPSQPSRLELDTASVARFEAGAGAARAAIAELQRIEAERRAEDEMRAARRASRAALIERINSLRGDDPLDQLERAPEEWAAIGTTPEDPDVADMQAALDAAIAGARQRHQNRLDLQQTQARLQELAAEAERLSERSRCSGTPGPRSRLSGTSCCRARKTSMRSAGNGSNRHRAACGRRTRTGRPRPSGRAGNSCSASSS